MGKTYNNRKLLKKRNKSNKSNINGIKHKSKLKKSPAVRKQINRIFRKKNKNSKEQSYEQVGGADITPSDLLKDSDILKNDVIELLKEIKANSAILKQHVADLTSKANFISQENSNNHLKISGFLQRPISSSNVNDFNNLISEHNKLMAEYIGLYNGVKKELNRPTTEYKKIPPRILLLKASESLPVTSSASSPASTSSTFSSSSTETDITTPSSSVTSSPSAVSSAVSSSVSTPMSSAVSSAVPTPVSEHLPSSKIEEVQHHEPIASTTHVTSTEVSKEHTKPSKVSSSTPLTSSGYSTGMMTSFPSSSLQSEELISSPLSSESSESSISHKQSELHKGENVSSEASTSSPITGHVEGSEHTQSTDIKGSISIGSSKDIAGSIPAHLLVDTSKIVKGPNEECCGNRTIMVRDPTTGKNVLYFIVDSEDLQNAIDRTNQGPSACINNLSESMNEGPTEEINIPSVLGDIGDIGKVSTTPVASSMVSFKDIHGNLHTVTKEAYDDMMNKQKQYPPSGGPTTPAFIQSPENYPQQIQPTVQGMLPVSQEYMYPQININNYLQYGRNPIPMTFSFPPNISVQQLYKIINSQLRDDDKISALSGLILYGNLKPNTQFTSYSLKDVRPDQIENVINRIINSDRTPNNVKPIISANSKNITNTIVNKINNVPELIELKNNAPLQNVLNIYYNFELYPNPVNVPITLSNNLIVNLRSNITMTVKDLLKEILETKKLQDKVFTIIQTKAVPQDEPQGYSPTVSQSEPLPLLIFISKNQEEPRIIDYNMKLMDLTSMINNGYFKIINSDDFTDYDISSLLIDSNTYFGGPEEYRPEYLYKELMESLDGFNIIQQNPTKNPFIDNIQELYLQRNELENKLKELETTPQLQESKEQQTSSQLVGGNYKSKTKAHKLSNKRKTHKLSYQIGGDEQTKLNPIEEVKSKLKENEMKIIEAIANYITLYEYGNQKYYNLESKLSSMVLVYKCDLYIDIYNGSETMVSLSWLPLDKKFMNWSDESLSKITNYKISIECDMGTFDESGDPNFGPCEDLSTSQQQANLNKTKMERFKSLFKKGKTAAQEILIPFKLSNDNKVMNYKVNGLITNRRYKFTISLVTSSPLKIIDINNTQIGTPYIPLDQVNDLTIEPTLTGGVISWQPPNVKQDKQSPIKGYLILIEPARDAENTMNLVKRVSLQQADLSTLLSSSSKSSKKSGMVTINPISTLKRGGALGETETETGYIASGSSSELEQTTSIGVSSMTSEMSEQLEKEIVDKANNVLMLLGGNPYYLDTTLLGKNKFNPINDFELIEEPNELTYELDFKIDIKDFTIRIAAYNNNGLGKLTKKNAKVAKLITPVSKVESKIQTEAESQPKPEPEPKIQTQIDSPPSDEIQNVTIAQTDTGAKLTWTPLTESSNVVGYKIFVNYYKLSERQLRIGDVEKTIALKVSSNIVTIKDKNVSSFDVEFNKGGIGNLFSYRYKLPALGDKKYQYLSFDIAPYNKQGIGNETNPVWFVNDINSAVSTDSLIISNSKTLGDYIATYGNKNVGITQLGSREEVGVVSKNIENVETTKSTLQNEMNNMKELSQKITKNLEPLDLSGNVPIILEFLNYQFPGNDTISQQNKDYLLHKITIDSDIKSNISKLKPIRKKITDNLLLLENAVNLSIEIQKIKSTSDIKDVEVIKKINDMTEKLMKQINNINSQVNYNTLNKNYQDTVFMINSQMNKRLNEMKNYQKASKDVSEMRNLFDKTKQDVKNVYDKNSEQMIQIILTESLSDPSLGLTNIDRDNFVEEARKYIKEKQNPKKKKSQFKSYYDNFENNFDIVKSNMKELRQLIYDNSPDFDKKYNKLIQTVTILTKDVPSLYSLLENEKNIIKRDLNIIADSIKNHEPVPVITSEEVETLPKPGQAMELTGYSSNEEELEEAEKREQAQKEADEARNKELNEANEARQKLLQLPLPSSTTEIPQELISQPTRTTTISSIGTDITKRKPVTQITGESKADLEKRVKRMKPLPKQPLLESPVNIGENPYRPPPNPREEIVSSSSAVQPLSESQPEPVQPVAEPVAQPVAQPVTEQVSQPRITQLSLPALPPLESVKPYQPSFTESLRKAPKEDSIAAGVNPSETNDTSGLTIQERKALLEKQGLKIGGIFSRKNRKRRSNNKTHKSNNKKQNKKSRKNNYKKKYSKKTTKKYNKRS